MKFQTFNCYYDFCGKSFSSKYNFVRHINSVHLEIKECQCETCGKLLSNKFILREHMNSHLKLKPIKCPYLGCNMAFSRATTLCLHTKTHSSNEVMIPNRKKPYDSRNDLIKLKDINNKRQLKQMNIHIPIHHLLIN